MNWRHCTFAPFILILLALATAESVSLSGSPATLATIIFGSNSTRHFPHFWEKCVGSGHAKLALRQDWRDQLAYTHDSLGVQSVRFHGIFDDDMGPVVQCDGSDSCSYNYTSIDSVFDFLVSIGIAPYVELSFMPTAIASGNATYLAYKANVTPPKSVQLWTDLIQNFASHLIARYGLKTVQDWNFEVWNEPNLAPNPFGSFWSGTQAEYFHLYNATAFALKTVSKQLNVGGPASAGGGWMKEFLSFVSQHQVPLDFISTHHYPNGDRDRFSLRRDIADDLQKIDNFQLSSKSRVRNFTHVPYVLSEFNSGLLGILDYDNHDEPFAAAFVSYMMPLLARSYPGSLNRLNSLASYWTFSDIFEEVFFDSVPFHDGFGMLTVQGIPKPVFRAFELLHEAGDQQLPVNLATIPNTGESFANVSASFNQTHIQLILTNFQTTQESKESKQQMSNISVVINGLSLDNVIPGSSSIRRIDDDHANAIALWRQMGSPWSLTDEQKAKLMSASELKFEAVELASEGSQSVIIKNVLIPSEGTAAILIPLKGEATL